MGGQISQKAITGTCIFFYTSDIHFGSPINIISFFYTSDIYFVCKKKTHVPVMAFRLIWPPISHCMVQLAYLRRSCSDPS